MTGDTYNQRCVKPSPSLSSGVLWPNSMDQSPSLEVLKHRCPGLSILIKYPNIDTCTCQCCVQVLQLRVQHLVTVRIKLEGTGLSGSLQELCWRKADNGETPK